MKAISSDLVSANSSPMLETITRTIEKTSAVIDSAKDFCQGSTTILVGEGYEGVRDMLAFYIDALEKQKAICVNLVSGVKAANTSLLNYMAGYAVLDDEEIDEIEGRIRYMRDLIRQILSDPEGKVLLAREITKIQATIGEFEKLLAKLKGLAGADASSFGKISLVIDDVASFMGAIGGMRLPDLGGTFEIDDNGAKLDTVIPPTTTNYSSHKYDPDVDGKAIAEMAKYWAHEVKTSYKTMSVSRKDDGSYTFGCAGFVAYIYNMFAFPGDVDTKAAKSSHYRKNADGTKTYDPSVPGFIGGVTHFFSGVTGKKTSAGDYSYNQGFELVKRSEAREGDLIVWVDGDYNLKNYKDIPVDAAHHIGIITEINDDQFNKSKVVHSYVGPGGDDGVCETTIKKYNDSRNESRGQKQSYFILRYTGDIYTEDDDLSEVYV